VNKTARSTKQFTKYSLLHVYSRTRDVATGGGLPIAPKKIYFAPPPPKKIKINN